VLDLCFCYSGTRGSFETNFAQEMAQGSIETWTQNHLQFLRGEKKAVKQHAEACQLVSIRYTIEFSVLSSSGLSFAEIRHIETEVLMPRSSTSTRFDTVNP
jgi:hypothetical protein